MAFTQQQYAQFRANQEAARSKKSGITPEKIAEKAASKYRNVKVENEYGKFDSVKEANRYPELLLLQRCGKISNLRRQVPFRLLNPFYVNGKWEPGIEYVADYVYEKDWNTVVEDVKWVRTEVFKLKRQLLIMKHPEIIFLET